MSTTIHLPPNLLTSVDQRANELGLSRNRYIIRALEKALETETAWSPGFIDELAAARFDDQTRKDLEELVMAVAANRTRKAPPAL